MRRKDLRLLRRKDFRRTRAYLADHIFASAPGRSQPPTDPIGRKAWDSIVRLPDDVLLRTADYQGSLLEDCHAQWGAWTRALPDASHRFMFDPSLDAGEEFQAAPLIAAQGWYRQSTAALRNALEGMTIAAALAVRVDSANYARWRSRAYEPKFGNAVDILQADASLAAVDARLGGAALFGRNPDGVLRELYGRLCRFAHSQPGYTNSDIWQSNGPIWIGGAFRDFWVDFCDTFAASLVLLRIGAPTTRLPRRSRSLFGAVSPRWHGLGKAVRAEFFT